MAYRPHSKARVSALNPRAWGLCQRCNEIVNHYTLRWQYVYAGPNLQNTFLLVCDKCLDIPNPQLKPRILPPDPEPIQNPRVPDWSAWEDSYLTTQDGNPIVTQDGNNIVLQQNFDIPDDFPD